MNDIVNWDRCAVIKLEIRVWLRWKGGALCELDILRTVETSYKWGGQAKERILVTIDIEDLDLVRRVDILEGEESGLLVKKLGLDWIVAIGECWFEAVAIPVPVMEWVTIWNFRFHF